MTSPRRTQHVFSVRSPGSSRKYNDLNDTSVNIATAIHNSKRGDSYYASPSNKFTREKTANVLDIRNIDHDAIRNDPELWRLSRNPSAFNMNDFNNDHQAFYQEEEDSNDDDDDDDLFAEEENLVNNPEEESRLRSLFTQSSSSNASSNQNVPTTPKRTPSFFTATLDNDMNLVTKLSNYSQHNFTKTAPYKSGTGGANHGSNNNSSNWRNYVEPLFFQTLKGCVWLPFMIYWIVKEPIIRIAAFFTMMVSIFFVDPTLYIWSQLPNNQHWIPSLERRKQITTISTIILFVSLSITVLPYISPHLPASVLKSMDYLTYHYNYYQTLPQQQFNPDLSRLIKSFNKDHVEIWAMIEKLNTEQEKKWNQLAKDQSLALQDKDKMWSELALHQSRWNTLDNEKMKIWDKLEQHEQQIHQIQQFIDTAIQNTIGSQLPENILVQTNTKGELELSPQFYTLLQNPTLWTKFADQNQEAIHKYLTGEMKSFFEKQQKQGAVIGKEAFKKLVSSTLAQHGSSSSKMDENGNHITLESLIESALTKYHQDVLNTADYALASRGARIIHRLTSSTHHPLPAWLQAVRQAAGLPFVAHAPEMAITPQIHAGVCWSMHGNQGSLGIALSEPVIVQGITIEYPSKEVMNNRENAPKEMELYGIMKYPKNLEDSILIGSLTYDINGQTVQTSDFLNPTEIYTAILLKIKSNWGSLDHTDMYRIRIHGLPA